MSAERLSYAVVTPAHDEADNLPRLAGALIAQSRRPRTWVIVENGSRDGTLEVARALAADHPWIEVRSLPAAGGPERGGAVVRAIGAAIEDLEPPVELRRLRMREAAGRQFADVVIGVPGGAAVGQGHAAADAVEEAVKTALPRSDVVVHVEPGSEQEVRDRAHAAALGVEGVREVHNVSVLRVGPELQIALHLKLPGELPLDDAHELAERVERSILLAVPEAAGVQTHIEPLAEAVEGAEVERDRAAIVRIVEEETGHAARELRFLTTSEGTIAFLTLGVDGATPLADAHSQASRVEERIRLAQPEIDEIIVHTEP
jgi:divalent metal cation (Fe/Co/Zn/Cd) transporter